MNVAEYYKQDVRNGMFGLEFEVEGRRLPAKVPDGWVIDPGEGSLRDGGLEYVMEAPKKFHAALSSIKKLTDTFEKQGTIPVFSPRTSVHVHVNVQFMSAGQLSCMYLLSLIVEPIISKMCGDLREGNNFCMRGIDCEGILSTACKLITDPHFQHIPRDQNKRYGFTNPCSVRRFGSLEYRGMQGTFDLKLIREWLTILENIQDASAYESPKDMLDNIYKTGLKEFLFENKLIPSLFFSKDQEEELFNRLKLGEEVLFFFLAYKDSLEEKEEEDLPYIQGGNPIPEGVKLNMENPFIVDL